MKFLKIRLLFYVVAAILLCYFMEYVELIIAMTLMVMVMDWAGTSWYFLNRRAEAGDEKSRLKLEKVKKVIDNVWLNLFSHVLVWGFFALITHCSGKVFIGVTVFCLLGAGLTVCGHIRRKRDAESMKGKRDTGIARNVKADSAAGVFLTKEKRGILRLRSFRQ